MRKYIEVYRGHGMKKNPFAINFGKVPSQYISRELIIDEIVQEMLDEDAQNNCFMLTGIC